jgi:hypothetical protein
VGKVDEEFLELGGNRIPTEHLKKDDRMDRLLDSGDLE